MATDNSASTPAASQPVASPKLPTEIKIVSHSNLYYWWPVWVVGFVMGAISWVPHYQLVPVPSGTLAGTLEGEASINVSDSSDPSKMSDTIEKRPKGTPAWFAPKDTNASRIKHPGVTVSTSSRPGVIFCILLLLVITITNIKMRGLWSLIVIVVIVALVVILALIGAWDWIFGLLSILDIRISTGGYIVVSTVLLLIWLIVFFLFDPQRYIVFTGSNFRVRLEIGEGEETFDNIGMNVKKERSDFFRHWILGLGSGDMVVSLTGARQKQFDLPNVTFINGKINTINQIIDQRPPIN